MARTRSIKEWQDGDGPREDDGTPTAIVELPPSLRFHAPIRATVTLHRPICEADAAVEASFGTRLVRDHDGTSTLEGAATGALAR